jgi:hypothetical protein
MRRGEVHTSQHVAKNNRIANNIVDFHQDLRGLFKQKLALLSNINSKQQAAGVEGWRILLR